MPRQSIDRINAAVRTCLDRCYAAENPLAAIEGHLVELRKQGSLSEDEILNVRATVARLLRQIAGNLDDTQSA